MAEKKAKFDIDIRNGDGVYLVIDNSPDGERVARKDVLELIEAYNIQDLDFMAISSAFKTDALHIEVKLSSNTNVLCTPEAISIDISKDRMEAYIKFEPPINKGRAATVESIGKAIEQAGIRFGVPAELPRLLLERREYGKKYVIARGKNAVDGINGYIEYNFDTSKKTYKPRETEDGRVDFRNLDLIEMTETGKVLATIVQPVPGTDGINVLGQVVTARSARPAPAVIPGKGAMLSEDGSQIIATESGQILSDGKKISVSPLLEINGNVDNSTGNIDFNGSIIIKGNVLTGFSVSAVGNIEVYGVVECAKVKSDNSIILYTGIRGNEKGTVIAKGSITTKYAESCVLEAGGDIVSDSILHSHVICGGNLTIKGKNGLLVGGKTKVSGRVEAQIIGSVMTTGTIIEVGIDPYVLQEFRSLQYEFTKIREEFAKHDRLFMSLSQAERNGNVPLDKKMLLLKTINIRTALRERYDVIQERIKELLPKLDGAGDIVTVSNIMHPGVKLLIGNASMQVHNSIQHSSLKNIDGRIVILPL